MIINIIIISVTTEFMIYKKIRDGLGWVGLDFLVCIMDWVGLGQRFDGLGWVKKFVPIAISGVKFISK